MQNFKEQCKILIENMQDSQGYISCEHCDRTDLGFEVHHIFFRSEIPKHKETNNIKNLILLCVNCHQEFHQKKDLRNAIVEERELLSIFGEQKDR